MSMNFLFSLPTSGGYLALYILGAAILLCFFAMIVMFFSGSKKRKKQRAEQAKRAAEKRETPAVTPEKEVEFLVVSSDPLEASVKREEPVAEETVEETPEETVEETVVTPEEEPEEPVGEEPVEDEGETADGEEPEDGEEAEEGDNSVVMLGERRILVQYDRSFLSRLIQSDEVVQGYYSELKNNLLSYEKVKSRVSWTNDSFRSGRTTVARFGIRNKILSIYLAVDPASLEDSKYSVEDVSDIKKYEQTPARIKLKSARAVKRAAEVIELMMDRLGIEMGREQNKDYSLPYETSEALIYRLLIKLNARDENGEAVTDLSFEEIVNAPSEKYRLRTGKKIRKSVSLETAQATLSDEMAATFLNKAEPTEAERAELDPDKKQTIDLETLARHFATGETADLASIKEKGLVAKDTGYIVVTGQGTLSKALTVRAQEFDLNAVKMLATVGGEPIEVR